MVIQSRPLRLLMTRPKAQGLRFARDLRKALVQPLRITLSPLIQPFFLPVQAPGGQFHAVIFMSETGVISARSILDLPRLAYCVGDQTARAAIFAGFTAISAAGDADQLVRLILQSNPTGPLLHISGEETRGDVVGRLISAGVETFCVTSYRQVACDLTPAARRLLSGAVPVIVPLFSPRTAGIFADLAEPIATAPLYMVALSPAVARASGDLAMAALVTADTPTADAMIVAIRQAADMIPLA